MGFLPRRRQPRRWMVEFGIVVLLFMMPAQRHDSSLQDYAFAAHTQRGNSEKSRELNNFRKRKSKLSLSFKARIRSRRAFLSSSHSLWLTTKELTFPQHSSSEMNLQFLFVGDICEHITCTCLFRKSGFILHFFLSLRFMYKWFHLISKSQSLFCKSCPAPSLSLSPMKC